MNGWLKTRKHLVLPLLMLVVILILFAFGSDILITPKSYTFDQLDDGWSVRYGETSESDITLSKYIFQNVRAGDTITISKDISTKNIVAPTIMFKSHMAAVDVSVDGENMYSFGHEDYNNWHFVPKKYHMITLVQGMTHTIEITYTSAENNDRLLLSTPRFGTKMELVREFFQTHRLPVFVGGFFIMYACVLLTLGSFLFLYHERDLTLFSSAGISFLFGAYTYAYNDIFCFLSDRDFFFSLLEYTSLYLLPLSISLFLYATHPHIATKRQRILIVINILVPVNFMLMRMTGSFRVSQMISVTQLVAFVEILILLPALIKGVLREREERILSSTYTGVDPDTYLLLGFIIMMAGAFLEITKYTILRFKAKTSAVNNLNFLTMGALLFVMCLFIYYFFNGIDHMNAKYVKKQLEGLAYTDALTGLMNRAKCMQFFAALNGPYAIVSIDLDRLKSVNDTFGHLEGDRMIRAFSDLVKKAFEGASLIGRTGGDEFVVIFESPTADVCDRAIRSLEEYMQEYNKGNEKFTLSASAGYAYSNELTGAQIEDVYFLADTRMYKMKEAHHNA